MQIKHWICVFWGLSISMTSWADQGLTCELFDLATGQVLSRGSTTLVSNEQSALNLEGLGVWGAVVDRPLEKGLREHFVVANNLGGEQESKIIRYRLGEKPEQIFPAVHIRAPKVGDSIRFQCSLNP